tara:strand:+ start:964 stop:2031 length:1068 start_codon:yes stop_codon:yes gene_type:complete
VNILLLGDFSSLHKNLKDGLIELGHDVTIASDGDGYKSTPRDLDLNPMLPSYLGKIETRIKLFFYLYTKFKEYDVVQLINTFHFYKVFFPNKFFIKKLCSNNKKVFLLAAGTDSYYWKYGKTRMEYSPHNDVLKYDLKSLTHPYESKKMFNFNEYVACSVDGIIPVSYEYMTCYKNHPKLLNFIEMPMNSNEITYSENIVGDKLIIFHGLNRYGFKGTRHVEKAFRFLKQKYPNDLELIIKGNMPLKDYLLMMQKTNVVIDQTYGYSQGMNGIYALAMGKIVLGGAEPESLKCMEIDESPVINIKPNAKSIIHKIEDLIIKKKFITEMGLNSRKFVERIHGHKKVASKFIATWKI